MFLKELEIYGFKSFPNKTKFSFNSGITAIVGPNGCGKSNIADAVRWVLGEQNIRSLRGKKLTDIIYTGNNHNGKTLNLAEVSLTFDNSQKIFPIDREEVSIRRRIYRSGETENFINGFPCRLKEIHNLLLNTGLGKNTYSMIAQGEIDIVLSAKPSDRRYLFEEAALISRYKYEKQNTLKKIEETSNNLVRAENVLSEIRNQLVVLEQEAIHLDTYKDYKERITEYELYLLCQRYNSYKNSFLKIQNNIKTYETDRLKKIEDLHICENEINILREKIERQKKQWQVKQQEIGELQKKINEEQNRLNLEIEKNNETNRRAKEISRDIENISSKINSIKNNNSFNQKKIKELNEKLNVIKLLQEKNKRKLTDIRNSLVRLNSLKENIRRIFSNIENKVVFFRENKIKAETTKNLLLANLKRIQSRKNKLESDLKDTINKIEKYKVISEKKEMEHAEEFLEKNNEILKEVKNTLSRIHFDIEKSKHSIHLKDESIAFINKAIEDLEKGNEKQLNNFTRKYCRVYSDSICEKLVNVIDSVPADAEEIIEVALKNSLDTIIVDDMKNAFNLLKSLESDSFKDLKIISLDILEKIKVNDRDKIKYNFSGVMEYANEMIHCREKYKGVFKAILGDSIIVKDDSLAIELFKNYPGMYRFISKEGMIIRKDGTLYFNSDAKNKKNNLFRLKKDKNLLIVEVDKVNALLKEKQKLLEKNTHIHKYLLQENEQLKKKIIEYKKRDTGKTENINELKILQNDLNNSLKNINLEENNIAEEMKYINGKLLFYEQNYTQIHQYKNNIEDAFNNIHQIIRKKNKTVNDLSRDINDGRNELVVKSERINHLKDKEKDVQLQMDDLYDQINRKKTEQKENSARQEGFQESIELLRGELNILRDKSSREQSNSTLVRREINRQSELVEEKMNEKEMLQESCEIIKEKRHKEELVKVQYEEKYENVKNEASKDYQISFEKLDRYKSYCGSRKEASQQINDLREKILDMGQINFDAGNRYQEQLDRYNTLKRRYDELLTGKGLLIKLVAEIDNIAAERFKKTFYQVKKYFNEIFQRIFSGGEGILKLTTNEDITQSEIDIIASPPGKKNRNIELLSSGEKALTAIALLLALWKVNPSPFCFFDEIDTALDETNAEKLSTILKGDDLKKSQLLVITHQKSTMEAADTLCGITMQDAGISKLVSVKLTK